jgi:putative ABC transport system ATP-binding protein
MLLPTLSTLDNVATGLLYRGIRADERRRAARVALEAVGLAHRIGHRPAELSGGECQRVAIARALVGEPAFILADEPTGNVDSRQSDDIIGLLLQLNRSGVTIIVVTHNQTIADALPRTVRVRDGNIEHDTSTP